MKLGIDYKMVAARDTKEGDEIMFERSFANYVVEQVDTDAIGHVRHIHDSGMASSTYDPRQLLRVRI